MFTSEKQNIKPSSGFRMGIKLGVFVGAFKLSSWALSPEDMHITKIEHAGALQH